MSEDPRQATIAALAAATTEIKRARPVYSDAFRSWYAAFPRKRSPGDAWRAWKAIPDLPPLPVMLAALDWQRKTDQWTRDAGRWIPYPATYLRGRAWEDDPPSSGPWCAFHQKRRNDGHRAPSGPREGCPECKHLAARAGTRTGDPVPAADALPAPRFDGRESPELRQDWAAAFPGEPWPGYAAAFVAVTGRRGRL